jgi:hypothetical protein
VRDRRARWRVERGEGRAEAFVHLLEHPRRLPAGKRAVRRVRERERERGSGCERVGGCVREREGERGREREGVVARESVVARGRERERERERS